MKLIALKKIYDELNESQFGGRLYRPHFRATRNGREYASFEAYPYNGDHVMYFNTREIKGHWARSMVYHEMIHQLIEDFTYGDRGDHHGLFFWFLYRAFAPENVMLYEDLY